MEADTASPSVLHENYDLSAQYYFRPFLTAGSGEILWDKDGAEKNFNGAGVAGCTYLLHEKLALQADWTQRFSPAK